MSQKSPVNLSSREIQKFLALFSPASAAANEYPELTVQGAERFPHALAELCDRFYAPPSLTPFSQFNTEESIASTLEDRFRFYKTDKAEHNYHFLYGEILSRLGVTSSLRILEIGLGTNNPTKVSHMAERFNPGASLKAFRDVATNSEIYGADIDSDILFSENRIQTAWVDQMQPESFKKMNHQFGNVPYDLIIDDGLHSVAANLNTLLFSLTAIKPGGWVVIEDIWSGHDCWDIIYRLIPPHLFNRHIFTFKTRKRVFALEKLA